MLGSHFFTTSDQEKDHVLTLDNFVFESIGFRAFDTDSASTSPVHRFFNQHSGAHFFTTSEIEKESLFSLPNLIYEGEAFFAFG